jgi:hypothetical protein
MTTMTTMTNNARIMRKADALCKIIQRARQEILHPKAVNPYVRFAKALVLQQRAVASPGMDR